MPVRFGCSAHTNVHTSKWGLAYAVHEAFSHCGSTSLILMKGLETVHGVQIMGTNHASGLKELFHRCVCSNAYKTHKNPK